MIRPISLKQALGTLLLAMITVCHPAMAAEPPSYRLPNTFVLGVGWFDIFRDTAMRTDADVRLEHRWGLSLLPLANEDLRVLDPYFQIHPYAGVETTVRGSTYGFGGFVFDALIGRYFVMSLDLAAGIYGQGAGKRLGCPLEFRTMGEAGVRLDSGWRVTAYVSHTSNAELSYRNPGAEMAGGYLHIPINKP